MRKTCAASAGERLPLILALYLSLLVVGGGGAPIFAQSGAPGLCEEPSLSGVDARGLQAVYCTSSEGLRAGLEAVHWTARPVFYGAVPAVWGAALLRGGHNYSDAYRLTVAQVSTFGLVSGVKWLVGRPRPFEKWSISSRSSHYQQGDAPPDVDSSFPSGHAALAATLATSWSLSHPRWYVIAPGAAWAVGVSASRVYLGVHYPSDVIVGTLVGAGVGVLVHQLRATITPEPLAGHAGGFAMPISIRVSF